MSRMRNTLFTVTAEDGSIEPLTFYVLPVEEATSIKKLIRNGGGIVVESLEPPPVFVIGRAALAQEEGYEGNVYSSTLIVDAVRMDALPQDEMRYLVQSSEQRKKNVRTTYNRTAYKNGGGKRRPYTAEEDAAILKLVMKHSDEVVTGSRLFKAIADEMDTNRTWDSIRSHFRNKILPSLPSETQSELLEREPSNKHTRYSGQSEATKSRAAAETAEAGGHDESTSNRRESHAQEGAGKHMDVELPSPISSQGATVGGSEQHHLTPGRPMQSGVTSAPPSGRQSTANSVAADEMDVEESTRSPQEEGLAVVRMLGALSSRPHDVVVYALVALNGNIFDALLYLLDPAGYVHRTPKDRLPWTLGEDYALIQEGLDLEEVIRHRGQQAVERRYEFHSGRQ